MFVLKYMIQKHTYKLRLKSPNPPVAGKYLAVVSG